MMFGAPWKASVSNAGGADEGGVRAGVGVGRSAVAAWMAALLVVLVLLLAGGCAPSGRSPAIDRALNDYFIGQYELARRTLEPLAQKTDENYVLNNCRLGSVALVDYDLEEAEAAFYRAYEVMNSTGVNDAARSAVAVLLAEKAKVWKGEPFERAMANFYLGVVYYMREDYNNARAAFENALFKLRDYGESKRMREDEYAEVESNFSIAYIMLARCWQRLGRDDRASDLFDRVAQLRPDLRGLADFERHAGSNVLLVVDFGSGPEKITRDDNSLVAFAPHPREVGRLPRAQVQVNGRPVALGGANVPPIDLLELAQDRRWQSIDTIRLAKSVAGTGLMAVGAYQGLKRDPDYGSAAALLAAGALLKASATADIRHWEMLPRTVYLLPLRLPAGRHEITVSFGGGVSQTWRDVVAPDSGEATYYMRMSRLQRGPFQWPPSNIARSRGEERISHAN